MPRLFPLAALLALAAATACTDAPPPPAPPPSLQPPPITRPPAEPIYALVTANRDAARVIQGLEARGLRPVPDDVSAVDQLAGAPGYVWRVGERDYLHLHAYRDAPAAAAGARGFVNQVAARSMIIDWVGKPHLFQCGSALALYLGETPQSLTVLTSLCGPPVWMR